MYVMSYFRTSAEALHLAISDDGLRWQALNGNQPILRGETGSKTLRDPFVFQDQTGRFHLLATDGWKAHNIVHAASDDLFHWDEQQLAPVMQSVPGVRNCWAPECFYDSEDDLYRVIWSSSISEPNNSSDWNHRIWSVTTRDFQTYSEPHLFFDPGYSVIDATVVRHGERYLMVFKDERGENRFGTDWKAMRVCFASRAGGPWTEVSELVTPSLTEGPSLFRRGDKWVMIFDHFMEDRFGAMQSTDGVTWENISDQLQFPPGPRHASVLQLDKATSSKLNLKQHLAPLAD